MCARRARSWDSAIEWEGEGQEGLEGEGGEVGDGREDPEGSSIEEKSQHSVSGARERSR